MRVYGEHVDDKVVKRIFGTFPERKQTIKLEDDERARLNPLEECVFRLHVEHWIPRRFIYRMLRIKNERCETAYYNACLKLGVMVRYKTPKDRKDFNKPFMRRRFLVPIN